MSGGANGPRLEIREFERLADAREAWERIEAANPALGVFETYAYADLWRQYLCAECNVGGLILTIDGQPRLVLAVAGRKRRLSVIGQGPADSLTLPGSGPDLAEFRAALRHLGERGGWSDMRLYEVPEEAARAVERAAQDENFRVSLRLKSINPYVPLDQGWSGVLARLSPNFRHQLRKRTANLDAVGIVFEHHRPVPDLEARLDVLTRFEAASPKGREGTDLLGRPDIVAFLRDWFAELNRRGMLCVSTLTNDGNLVAYQIGFLRHGRYSLYNRAYDPEFARNSPGMVLEGHVMKRLIADGATEYDMSRGVYPAKERWHPLSRRQYDVTVYRRLRGRVRYWSDRLRRSAKDATRRALSIEARY